MSDPNLEAFGIRFQVAMDRLEEAEKRINIAFSALDSMINRVARLETWKTEEVTQHFDNFHQRLTNLELGISDDD